MPTHQPPEHRIFSQTRVLTDYRLPDHVDSAHTATLTPDTAAAIDITTHMPDAELLYDRSGDDAQTMRISAAHIARQVIRLHHGLTLTPLDFAGIVLRWRHGEPPRMVLWTLGETKYAAAAEELALTLTRATTGSDRAGAAALLGYLAYRRDDRDLAAAAFRASIDSNPNPDDQEAKLLGAAMMSGMPPSKLVPLARLGTLRTNSGRRRDAKHPF